MTAALLVFGFIFATAPVARAASGRLVFDASIDHADYATGEADTLTTSIAWRAPRWSLSVTVPYVSKDLPVLLRLGDVTVPTPPGPGEPPDGIDPGAGQGPNDDPGGGNDDPGGGDGGQGNGSGGSSIAGGASDGGSGNGGGGGGGSGNGNGGDGGSGDAGNGGDGGQGGDDQGNGQDGGQGGQGNGGGTDGGNGGGGGSGGGSDTAGDPTAPASANASGLGDPVLRLTLALPGILPGGGRWGLFAAAKAPVADDSLGTGEWDMGAGLLVWRSGLLTDAYLELGYWTLGDPEGVDLDDPVTWEAYLTRRLPNGRWAFAALTRGATEIYQGSGSTAEVGAWAGYFLAHGRSNGSSLTQSLGLTATAGLGDAAPDWRAILSWRLGFQGPGLLLGSDDDR